MMEKGHDMATWEERSEKVRRIMGRIPRNLVLWGWIIMGLVTVGMIIAALTVEWPY